MLREQRRSDERDENREHQSFHCGEQAARTVR
jgi:hypothetical protein